MNTREEIEAATKRCDLELQRYGAKWSHFCYSSDLSILLTAAKNSLVLERQLKSSEEIKTAEKKILIEEVAKNHDLRQQLSTITAENLKLRSALEKIALEDGVGLDLSPAGKCHDIAKEALHP